MLARIEQFADVMADSKQQISKVGMVWQVVVLQVFWWHTILPLLTPGGAACGYAAISAQIRVLPALQCVVMKCNSRHLLHDTLSHASRHVADTGVYK